MKYFYWLLLWPIMFVIGLFGMVAAPSVACCVVGKQEMLYTKRYGDKKLSIYRERLVWWLTWFDTFDNPTDEYWYGIYKVNSITQADYDRYPILRWIYRTIWLQRNSMYTLNYKVFGISKESCLAWQFKATVPLAFGYSNNINIGWKAHEGFEKLMYAGRIFGLRKDK